MPNTLSALPSSTYKVTNDPTATIAGNVPSDISENPFAEMTDEILFGAVNLLLQDIDDATGLDLLGMVTPLEDLLGAEHGLLSGLVGFLDPSSSTAGGGVLGPLLDLIPGLGGGTGTLGGLGSFLNPTSLIGAAAGVLAPLLSGGNILGSLIPGLDASKIISGTLGSSLLQPVIDAISTGFGGSTGLSFPGLQAFLGGLSLVGVAFDDIIGVIPGIGSGLSGATGLGSIFTDLTHILGSPTGLGTGAPTLPGIGSIPILGGLLSGGTTLLGSLIPGLDASKIVSGLFPISQITNLATLLGGFGTGTSILAQLLAAIPGQTGGLSGLAGLGSVFTDLTHILGSPTGLGSGTPSLPSIGSIPLLGGLLSGATLLGSLIPGLDASKVNTGTFADSFLPGLGSLMDNVFGGVTQGTVSGTNQSAVNTVLSSQSSTVAAQGSLIQQVKAALSTGTTDNDTFERTTGIGSAWASAVNGGALSITSGKLHYSQSGSSAEYVMQKTDVIPVNDHMISTVTLAQAVPSYPLFTPLPYGSYVDVWVRMGPLTSMSTRNGVVLRINSAAPYLATWNLYNVVNGVFSSSLANGTCPLLGNGDSPSLEAGAGGTTRRFLGTINGASIGCDFTDSSNVTSLGATFRRRGFGGKGNSGVGLSTACADVQGWTGG